LIYLLDTCAYLRLAKDIHPLLGGAFFSDPETASVTSEVDTEWSRAPRLQTKFHWVSESQFVSNRAANTIPLTGSMPTQILKMRSSLSFYAQSQSKTLKGLKFTIPSSVDCMVLAYVFVLNQSGQAVTAVSDDGGLNWIAKQMKVPCMQSEDLLKRMFDAQKLTGPQIKALAGYLDYIEDLPHAWRIRGPALFGMTIP
jgi:hypothetical protein